MLRDRLVCGVNHQIIQKKLLGEKDLTFDKAFALAQSIELAERDAKKLKNGSSSHPQPQVFYNKSKAYHYSSPSTNTVKREREVSKQIECYRCGRDHLAPACTLNPDTVCSYCKKTGHLARVCRSKHKDQSQQKGTQPKRNLYLSGDDVPSVDAYDMFSLQDGGSEPIRIQVSLNNVPTDMVLDTGASLSIISQSTYRELQSHGPTASLEPSTARLQTYTGEVIPVVGTAQLAVRYETTVATLSVQVVEGDGPNLLGRDWLHKLQIPCGHINLVKHDQQRLHEILQKHDVVFGGSLGCMKDVQITLQVDSKVKPKFLKPRSVPFALKDKVEQELNNLEQRGIISPVKHSSWAAPIVPVIKKNGSVRVCGDFKTTLNQAGPAEVYPLPRVEELFADLSGGCYFSKVDLSDAYLQLPLSDASKELVTINTLKGLFQYNRLPFGVASAPAIFQRTMETLMRGVKGTSVYIDDILVTGSSVQEHLQNLDTVLDRLESAGLRANRKKSFFLQARIEYLGHIIDKDGLHPTEEKVTAIKKAPPPKNITELRSFLGLISYYGKFLPSLADKLTPLYDLLGKNKKWFWSSKQQQAFQIAKDALQTDAVLVHFDSTKPLVLACDASQYGLGAVLSHVMDDGQEKPIAYASRTLNSAERNYSQLDREGLAIIFGVKKFHSYLYGHHFSIQSDHQPLAHLFSEKRGIPAMASARIQRWALTLAAYQYNIRYKSGSTLNNADAFSRLPQPVTISADNCFPADLVHLIFHLEATSINAGKIKDWTAKDPLLARVLKYTLSGWPSTPLEDNFKPFIHRKSELSVLDGCLLWGSRIVIPPQGRKIALQELHDTHPGCNKMKGLSRNYIWWPKMDTAIEDIVKTCPLCQESRPLPTAAPLHPWEWPSQPWSRIHLDFAGPFLGSMYLLSVDAHSKWLDIFPMQSISSAKTIEKLRILFANHGLPHKVVTDNGPSFTSAEFAEFMSKNGIIHIKSAPYHPSTNGLAERAVQSFKQAVKRIAGDTVQERISKFLFTYRITPHSVTGVAPAELLMGRRLRSRLDTWHPDLSKKVSYQQERQKRNHDSTIPLRKFAVGDQVYAKNYTSSSPQWLAGTVIEVTGPLSYKVILECGNNIVRRHVDSVRPRHTSEATDDADDDPLALPDIPSSEPVSEELPATSGSTAAEPASPSGLQPPSQVHRSARPHNPPDRYGFQLDS